MSEKAIAAKQEIVDQVVSDMEGATSVIVVDYLGLTVEEMTELRKELREADIKFKVVKNTIMRRAMDQMGVDYHDEIFVGPTAVAIGTGDSITPAHILAQFAKKAPKLELKGGVVEHQPLAKDDLDRLAQLPGREGLYQMLLSVLQAPMRNVCYALNALKDKVDADGGADSGDAPAEAPEA